MSTILLPPLTVFDTFLNRPKGFGPALKRLAKSSVDTKTVKRLFEGKASEGAAKRFLADLYAAFPHSEEINSAFNIYIAEHFSEPGQREELAMVRAGLSWQAVFFAMEQAARKDGKQDAITNSAFYRILQSLDRASVNASALANRGELAAATNIVAASAVGPFLSETHFSAMRAANSVEAFARASAPARLIGLLFLAAAFEHGLWRDLGESQLRPCLPIADKGEHAFPFARCAAQLSQRLGINSYDEFACVVLADGNAANLESQRKRYGNWRRGTIPEQSAFVAMVRRYFELKGQTPPSEEEVQPFYMGLRFMQVLAKAQVIDLFGSKKAFFDLYHQIHASMKE